MHSFVQQIVIENPSVPGTVIEPVRQVPCSHGTYFLGRGEWCDREVQVWGRSTMWAGQVRGGFSEEGACEVLRTRTSEPGTRPGTSTPSRGQRCWSGKGMESDFMFKKCRSGFPVSVYDKKPGWKQVHVVTTTSPHTWGVSQTQKAARRSSGPETQECLGGGGGGLQPGEPRSSSPPGLRNPQGHC